MKGKSTLILIFLLLGGFVIGGLIAHVTANILFLQWLGYGMPIGINNGGAVPIDLALFKISFGFYMYINVAEVVCIILALLLHRKIK
jgi:hypothetical protein